LYQQFNGCHQMKGLAMRQRTRFRLVAGMIAALVTMIVVLSSCNLGASQNEAIDLTSAPTEIASIATRTPIPSNQVATVSPIPFPTRTTGTGVLPTTQVILPPAGFFPTNTPAPISIFILSPTSGNIVAGNIQVLGSASHPQFLQYRLEYGPDPNPGNLWFPITGIVQSPVIAGTLGIWNTTTAATPDGVYQLRLRVFLRDGRQEITSVNNIRVQNLAPTPIPTNTPTVPRPIAAFTQDVTTGNAPLVVRFTNQSQGQITGYTWFFGDGTTSTEANPSHTYARAGVYTITLQVNGPGGSSNVSRQVSVTGINPPTAAFTTDKVSGTAPLTVVFTNRSSGNITGYSWDFGDGNTSTQTSPTHTFNTVGTFNVILEARGQGGVSRVVRQITVSNPQVAAPVADFTANPASGTTPLTVAFTNATTGQVTQYLWDFNGDGITDSVEISPTHVYDIAGNFTVNLTAIGPGGQSSKSLTLTIERPPDAPVAAFSASPLTGNAPLAVAFTNATTGNVTSFSWDFENDGTPDSTDQNPSYTYTQPGTYTARLTATGPGGSSSATQVISVTTPISQPQASFTANPQQGPSPLQVAFTNTSQGDALEFSWDLNGDGTEDSSEPNPAFTYQNPGSYTVRLTARNSAGESVATTTIVAEAAAVVPPTASFTANPTSGNSPLVVTFTNTTSGDSPAYSWDFNGDGLTDSTDASPTFQFTTAGTYVVTLVATNSAGTSSATGTIQVTSPVPVPDASFTANPTNGRAPLTVTFTNTTSQPVTRLEWDLDGNGSVDATTGDTTFVYNSPGSYVVTLRVFNDAGEDSVSQVITVSEAVPAPVASFSVSPTNPTVGDTVTFTNTTQQPIDALSWDLNGDGVPEDQQNSVVTFVYTTDGTFNATLTVSNASGSNTATQAVTVAPNTPAPVAAFSVSAASGTAPLKVQFTLDTVEPLDSFAWDFNGDGVVDNQVDLVPTFTYNTAGIYNATLTVTNAAGTDSISRSIAVTDPVTPPTAGFTPSVTQGTAPLVVSFTNTTSGNVTSFSWDFNGDGVPDDTSTVSPSFTYQQPGVYTVTLNVANEAGSTSASATIQVTASVPAPVASFTASALSVETNTPVTFTNTTQEPVDTLAWDFNGDGVPDNTTDQQAVYSYPVAGTYSVTFTVTNTSGSSSATQVITVTDPAPVPAGPQNIVFATNRTGNYEIMRTGEDGLNPTNLTNHPANDRFPAWSPDGSRIVFVSDRNGNDDIFVMNEDGSGLVQLTSGPEADTLPAWSDDGQIAFVRDGNIWVMSDDGSNQVQLTADPADETEPTWYYSQIVFASNINGNYDIFIMNADGSGITPLTTDGADDRQPNASTSQILFTSNRLGDPDIWVMNGDGSNVQQLTTSSAADQQARWTGAGSIVFVSNRDTGNNNLYLMDGNGQNQRAVTNDPSDDVAPDYK
jgi:PKD repeat protein